ncbi:MAG: ABC transporter ATP-binding protein [Albidovulum sp.]|nr:ABC transporter ATP-binding protein [Albidovulum sp.]
MAERTKIIIENLSKKFGSVEAISSLSATFDACAFTVILGPSGCGKSTLLHVIAGLETASAGKIFFEDREVQNLPARERGCAMVFQDYALYPHMNVEDNIGYALKLAKVPKTERRERIGRVAEVTGLQSVLERRPSQLSGGQRQRVAIARAIVREPRVLLFDEPFSNLDAQLRHDMRRELAELHQRIGATSVFVTHDQIEAMTMADKILVISNGRIEQFGTPDEVYHAPESTFVAGFIGSPPMNLINGTGDGGAFKLRDGTVLSECGWNGHVVLGIRPESVRVDRQGAVALKVRYCEKLGSHSIISAELADGQPMRLTTPLGSSAEPSSEIRVNFPAKQLHWFDSESGKVIPRRSNGIES